MINQKTFKLGGLVSSLALCLVLFPAYTFSAPCLQKDIAKLARSTAAEIVPFYQFMKRKQLAKEIRTQLDTLCPTKEDLTPENLGLALEKAISKIEDQAEDKISAKAWALTVASIVVPTLGIPYVAGLTSEVHRDLVENLLTLTAVPIISAMNIPVMSRITAKVIRWSAHDQSMEKFSADPAVRENYKALFGRLLAGLDENAREARHYLAAVDQEIGIKLLQMNLARQMSDSEGVVLNAADAIITFIQRFPEVSEGNKNIDFSFRLNFRFADPAFRQQVKEAVLKNAPHRIESEKVDKILDLWMPQTKASPVKTRTAKETP